MEALFLKLVNMSITASYLVLAVILFRILLKKAPKYIRCILWGLVGLRLILPFSIESVLSLIPSTEPLPEEFLYAATPQVNTGIAAVNNAVNPVIAESLTPIEPASANPTQIWSFIFARVWLIGVIAMALYALISYLLLRRRVRVSIKIGKNLRLCDHIGTPFILGMIRPQIYLPSSLDQKTADHVLAHEYAHLKRKDHWWKPLGFVLLSVYWFNPVLWLAYILLCRDIEMACDEKVVKSLDTSHKKEYSEALLRCSVPRRMITACPLAFGEVGVKSRIKSVLHYKKPAFWIIVVAIIVSIVVGVCFLTDPAGQSLSALGKMDASEIQSINVVNGERTYEITSQGGMESVAELIDETSVSRNEISKSRSDDRDKFHTIIVHFASTEWHYHFNESCTAVWLDDGVMPSFSYEVKNPERVLQLFKSAIETQAVNRLAVGVYIPVECVYMSPLSSYSAHNLSNEYRYEVTENGFYTDSVAFICNTNVDNVDWGWKPMYKAGNSLDWLSDTWPSLRIDALYQTLDDRNLLIQQEDGLFIVNGHASEHQMEQLWGIYRLVPENEMPDNADTVQWGDTAECACPDANMKLPMLEGWTYEITEYTDGDTPFGIRFRPERETEGWISLEYWSMQFAVCGTGLETVDGSFDENGYSYTIGYYDGSEIWSYLVFRNLPGSYVALREGGESWFPEYESEIMLMLSHAVLAEGIED